MSFCDRDVTRAFIFDLDGTLLDSLGDLADTVNHVLAVQGFPTHPEEAFRYFVGNGMTMLLRRAAPADLSDSDIPALVETAEARYAECWGLRTRPYPGISRLLRALAVQSVPLGVLSNKPDHFTRLMVAHFFPDIAFFDVRGRTLDFPLKPDPAAALDMAARLGISPEHIRFVGDSRMDMETARNAGMIPVGVTWGFRPRSELLENGAAHLAEKAEDLLDV